MGRKTKKGHPRHMYPKIDKGTPEAVTKRNQLLQNLTSKNPALTESLLGHFYAKGLISKSLYEAGVHFTELGYWYETCLGIPIQSRESPLTFRRRGISHFSDGYFEKHTQAWNQAMLALKTAGDESYQVVMGVIFYEKDIYQSNHMHLIQRLSFPLKQGLEVLDRYFRKGLRSLPHYTDL